MTEQRKISIKRLKVDELSIVADIARKTWPSAYSGIITDEQIEFMLGKMYSLETMSSEVEIKGICFEARIMRCAWTQTVALFKFQFA